MFDFSWSEIVLFVIVALVLIGPKDLPVALRALSRAIKALRRLASEFQSHLDEMVKEADLSETRNELQKLRRFSVRDQLTRVLDPQDQFCEDPFLESCNLGPVSQERVLSASERLPNAFQIGVQPHNVVMAARAEALDKAPVILPPAIALRLIEESSHWRRPAFLPPEVALHHGRRVLIVTEEDAHG